MLDASPLRAEECMLLKINALLLEMKKPPERRLACKLLILNGGQRRDRTADAGLFRAALYH